MTGIASIKTFPPMIPKEIFFSPIRSCSSPVCDPRIMLGPILPASISFSFFRDVSSMKNLSPPCLFYLVIFFHSPEAALDLRKALHFRLLRLFPRLRHRVPPLPQPHIAVGISCTPSFGVDAACLFAKKVSLPGSSPSFTFCTTCFFSSQLVPPLHFTLLTFPPPTKCETPRQFYKMFSRYVQLLFLHKTLISFLEVFPPFPDSLSTSPPRWESFFDR